MTTYKDLQEQIARLQDEAAIARRAELKATIASIREQMSLYGITADDLGIGSKSVKASAHRSTVAAKYRDPVSGKTWAGRGRAPLWIGGDPAKLLIG